MCDALRELMDDEFQEYGKQVTEEITEKMIKNAYESIKDKNKISQILKIPVDVVEKVLKE